MHIESLETRVQFSGNLSSWSGVGINSAGSPGNAGAIGIAEASVAEATTFYGQPIDSTATLIRYMMPGDPTLDGRVDRADVRIVVTNFNQAGGPAKGDSNHDGYVRIDDFAIMAQRANELAG